MILKVCGEITYEFKFNGFDLLATAPTEIIAHKVSSAGKLVSKFA